MKHYDRGATLTAELNDVLKRISGHKKDFKFTTDHLMQLKRVVAATNGLLTYRTTVLAMKWLRKHFSLTPSEYLEIMTKIKKTTPYTNGFDILIPKHKIVAEVKCYLPINDGEVFGAAQVNGILDDAIKLQEGKKALADTREFHKFIFISKVPRKTENAINLMLKDWNMTSKTPVRVSRHKIKNKLVFLKSSLNTKGLSKANIYIVEV